jgi:hypothetical protein
LSSSAWACSGSALSCVIKNKNWIPIMTVWYRFPHLFNLFNIGFVSGIHEDVENDAAETGAEAGGWLAKGIRIGDGIITIEWFGGFWDWWTFGCGSGFGFGPSESEKSRSDRDVKQRSEHLPNVFLILDKWVTLSMISSVLGSFQWHFRRSSESTQLSWLVLKIERPFNDGCEFHEIATRLSAPIFLKSKRFSMVLTQWDFC